MNEEIVVEEVEAEGVEVSDLGDVAAETRQTHWIQSIPDSMITWTWFAK